jgi:phosphoribosylformylglycinamidine cyclo-ligase
LKKKLVYRGKYKVGDQLPQDKRFLIWEALLSPTRTYLPLIRLILANVNRRYITGIIHCSGGGQTKIINFGQKGNTYVKYNMFPVPPVFEMIQEASGASWREMYEVFNMGHRLEMAVTDTKVARDIIALSRSKNIETQRVGEIIARATPEQHNSVVIESPQGAFRYPE